MVTAGSHPARRAVLSGTVASASGIGLLATSGWLITTASTRPPVLALAVAIGAVQAFALGRGLARYFERLGVHASALDRLGRLRLALFDDLQCRVPGVAGLDSSSVLTGFVSDAETVADEWAKAATGLIDLVSGVVLGTAVAAAVDPALGLRLLVGALAIAVSAALTARLARDAFVGEAQARRDLARAVTEAVGAAREMAAYGRQDLTQQQLATVRLRSVAAARRMGAWAALGAAAAATLSALALVSLLQAGIEGAAGRRISGVMLSVVVFTALAVLDQCASLPGLLLGRQRAAAAADRLAGVAAAPVPVAEPIDPSWSDPERVGGVSYDGVGVRVGERDVLRGVDLDLAPGERVAVVGPNGAGKSTLVHALLRFVSCSEGSVRVGGADVAGLPREQLAAEVGWVGDDAYIFAGTVRGNLRLAARDATDDRLREVLAGVGLDGWLAGLPDGLDTVIGAGGRPVSSGERQRLGVARGLVGEPRILVLDEPTAHVDPASARRLVDDALAAAGTRSVMAISHDPDVVERFERVVTLVSGRVVPPHRRAEPADRRGPSARGVTGPMALPGGGRGA